MSAAMRILSTFERAPVRMDQSRVTHHMAEHTIRVCQLALDEPYGGGRPVVLACARILAAYGSDKPASDDDLVALDEYPG